MGKNSFYFILLVIILCLVGVFAFNSFNVLQEKNYVVKFELGGRPGFDLNSTALTFGRIPVNSSASRAVFIENQFDMPVIVSFSTSKEISPYLFISENDFFLNPGENKTVSFYVYSIYGAPQGSYVGNVKLKVSRYSLVS